ncbi:MAG TPA: epoxide hydrolase [Bryobacteraceae bacterium]|nr:epoxide hydrolase [Bryobacteraceae bacterium]
MVAGVFGRRAFPQAFNPVSRPFRVDIPQATIDRIRKRVRETRFPERLDSTDWSYGANWDYIKDLVAYWTSRYDWRKTERRLNQFPQFVAPIEGFDIHFMHVRGRGPRPFPIILTHGWPGSIVEFLETIGPLTDPARFGGAPEDAFDVVIPSLPGFGFSSKPKGKPVGLVSIARMWHTLMTEVLGYRRYGAQGGDWGSVITIQLAVQYPGELAGIHLNAATVPPAGDTEVSEEEQAWRRAANAFSQRESDYAGEQRNKPETVAFALADNPVGTAAWIIEKLKVWSDSGDDIESVFTKDDLLSNVMVYLVTDSAPTAVWIYRGAREEGQGGPARGKIEVPTAYAAFPREMTNLAPPRSALERGFNLVQYTTMPRGGHFAAFEQPKLFVADVRQFFRRVRS